MAGIKRRRNRNLAEKVRRYLEFFPVVAVVGARQVGKTELAKILCPHWQYFDLENPNDYDRVTRDPLFFFKEHASHIIIDEAQEYPELFQVLRGEIDRRRGEKGRFLLTGSSSPRLLKNISESLAGRIGIVELGTFKANEYFEKPLSPFYALFQDKLDPKLFDRLIPALFSQQVKQFWFKGGYPEPLLHPKKTFYRSWMENYQSTYLNRDLKKLFPKLNAVRYRRFLYMLARLSGLIVVKSDLARSLDVSEPTVKDYIDIAAGTFLWRNLASFEHTIEKSTVKMPRGHIRDSGLAHHLLKFQESEDLERDPACGRLFESFVIEEIIKGLEATMATNWSAHYYRTKNGAEIDLVLDGPFGLLPVEVKYGISVSKNDLRALKNFIQKHRLQFGILVNNSEKVEWIAPRIVRVPVGCL